MGDFDQSYVPPAIEDLLSQLGPSAEAIRMSETRWMIKDNERTYGVVDAEANPAGEIELEHEHGKEANMRGWGN
jgi:hypothetical protein